MTFKEFKTLLGNLTDTNNQHLILTQEFVVDSDRVRIYLANGDKIAEFDNQVNDLVMLKLANPQLSKRTQASLYRLIINYLATAINDRGI